MSLEYTLDFKADYKDLILQFLVDNQVDLSDINERNINDLSLKFHGFHKSNLNEENIQEDTSSDATYSSNMMIKWLNYLENEVRLSIDNIIEMAKKENVKITKFPLHFKLELDIESKSYQITEINNNFNINI